MFAEIFCLCRFTQLHSLNLSCNNINSFPLAVLELANLVELNLGGNRLTEIPTGIDQLHRYKLVLHADILLSSI